MFAMFCDAIVFVLNTTQKTVKIIRTLRTYCRADDGKAKALSVTIHSCYANTTIHSAYGCGCVSVEADRARVRMLVASSFRTKESRRTLVGRIRLTGRLTVVSFWTRLAFPHVLEPSERVVRPVGTILRIRMLKKGNQKTDWKVR